MSAQKDLVQINGKAQVETNEKATASGGMSRRKFLKILGASSTAVGVAACADSPSQKILPFVKGEQEQIPGVAVWYSSTCSECSAACGTIVRTREGRAVKIEGNPQNPVNRGGLCALGQAALQGHYDPDRIRQPLQKGISGFTPIAWEAAYGQVADLLKGSGKKLLITGEISGANEELIAAWCERHKVEHVVYDALQPIALAQASELVYGSYGIPEYRFDKAQVVLNFGADFLETWVSPVGFARDWAIARKSHDSVKVIHVEPRLSLTGANADLWLCSAPGSELAIAKGILKVLLESGRGDNLAADNRARLMEICKSVNLDQVCADSGVEKDKILLVVNALMSAKRSLVIAGGSAAASSNEKALQVVCALINTVLQNVGETVLIGAMRKPRTSLTKLNKAIESMTKGDYSVIFTYGTNPQFSLPSSYGFGYARKTAQKFVSFSTHLDDTAQGADLILPSSSSLESWGDVRFAPGVYGLQQPTMGTIFDTKPFGDSLIEITRKVGDQSAFGGAKDFETFLKASWEKLYGVLGMGMGFQKFWNESVERGGYFTPRRESESGNRTKLSGEIFTLINAKAGDSATFDDKGSKSTAPVLLPYFSVKTFDGRAANRPWLQELPDPISQVVWDTWAEIHPDTAKANGLENGDMVSVRNFYGELSVPVYLTPYVHKSVVAVPIGQGHTAYGRYAKKVGGGNVLEMLPAVSGSGRESVSFVSARVDLIRGRGRAKMVNVQGSDSQLGRELARTTVLGGAAAHSAHAHAEHKVHEPLQMYEQREHPVYKWGMAVDLASCTGCSACVVACFAENNIPVAGKEICWEEREMSWLRIERYFDGPAEELVVNFLPMMCQHCGNAPCEPVCPVYATYHSEEGLNNMIYNRCVGTRYCSNNCSYKVRRFNWYQYEFPEPLNMQLNPDVTKRDSGVMEKCTFCVQRILEAKDSAKDAGRLVRDGEVKPACVQSCPTQALAFGNLNDPKSEVSKLARDARAYKILDHHLNTQPSVSYLSDVKYRI